MTNSLKAVAQQIQAGSELMTNRDKISTSEVINQHLTVRDFDFLMGKDGEYSVVVFDQLPGHFLFGGKVLTDHLKTYQTQGLHETIKQEGLPVKMVSKLSKNGFQYTDCVLFPED